MPYYTEVFSNTSYPTGFGARLGLGSIEAAKVTSFRSRPHPAAITSREVTSSSVDPYAYFLESKSTRDYQARLAERGLQPEGGPDRGHPFTSQRMKRSGTLYTGPLGTGNTPMLNGLVLPNPAVTSSGSTHDAYSGDIKFPSYSVSDLDKFGQTAYTRSAPDSVVFDAAQFLAELREGLPSMMLSSLSRRSSILNKAGSEYLNYQFGWMNLIRDIQDAVKALTSTTAALSSMGKRYHRQYRIPTTTASGVVSYTDQPGQISCHLAETFTSADTTAGASPNALFSGEIQKTKSVDRWFEGEFTHFLPLGFDPNSYLERASVLMSVKLTPSVLWELAPWSWLIDWSLKIGDTIAAAEDAANDKLIMHYGYAMEKTVYTTASTWTYSGKRFTTNPHQWVPVLSGHTYEVWTQKKRIRANPFGFKVSSPTALSGTQWSILSALGLSKGFR